VPDYEVPVVLEGNLNDLTCYLGKAKLHWREDVLFADLELLATPLKENGLKILYPSVLGFIDERRSSVIYKSVIRGINLTVGHNADERIGTLFNQGVR
jgi:hypothetical protein